MRVRIENMDQTASSGLRKLLSPISYIVTISQSSRGYYPSSGVNHNIHVSHARAINGLENINSSVLDLVYS